ncbi:ribonuclease HIII [Staphylococcus canis]|uniref:Ribonuclease HIII n=1 Tax=Staphylococcus canis TaxID=2724942 RepID=A0ABS0T6Z0_9STAP|nr:ribonuclease HIII [Staphylococcus canis]MBI5974504.1 ribonuclease HIII [Staphylococcus canis]
MANIVKKLTLDEIEKLESTLNFEITHLGPGMRGRVKYNGTMITIYHSHKVMFQGQNAESVVAMLLGIEHHTSDTSSSPNQHIPYNQFNCIGSDEAGSGDYFGPLTACACYVSKKHAQVLKELGVDDSKRLTDDKIVELAEQIVSFLPHSLLVLNNPKYNDKQQTGWSQVKMKSVLHNECIKNVLKKIDASELDYIVIDQFAEREVYQHYALDDVPLMQQTQFETKGESKSIAIAAASIISRYAFVKHMDQLSQRYHIDIPKGASKKVDLVAAQIIEKHGLTTLDNITKQHFANRKKARKLVDRKI